ncbi:MAG: DUF721 domain-containing protein [Bacteroidales bacterium]|nr:DUF721 domain-containing protein [Bacteroidales bacterium]
MANGLSRKEAVGVGGLISDYIKEMGLAPGMNTHRIFAAWDACSGAADFTLKRFFRSGTLYITVSSSVIRNQLYFQRDLIIEKMNRFLTEDELFTDDNRTVGLVEKIVLK